MTGKSASGASELTSPPRVPMGPVQAQSGQGSSPKQGKVYCVQYFDTLELTLFGVLKERRGVSPKQCRGYYA